MVDNKGEISRVFLDKRYYVKLKSGKKRPLNDFLKPISEWTRDKNGVYEIIDLLKGSMIYYD